MSPPFLADAAPGGLLDPLPVRRLTADGAVVYREVDTAAVARVADAVREAAAAYREMPFAGRTERLGAAAAAWLPPGSPWLAEAVARLHAVEGWAPRMLRGGLRHLLHGLTAPTLLELARRELGVAKDFGTLRSPCLVVVFASGNLPVAVLPHVVYALAVGAPVLVRVSRREPILLRLFRDCLEVHAPELAAGLALLHWPRETRGVPKAFGTLAGAEVVLAFGQDATLAEIAAGVPAGARYVPYGSRASLAILARERLSRKLSGLPGLAVRVGRDIAAFDQQGCHSPQAVYVEEGGEVGAPAFAAALADALAAWQERWPRRPLAAAEHAAIHQWRGAWEMRSVLDARARLWASPRGTDWSVVLDPEPGFTAPGLPRQAVVKPIPDLAALPEALQGWETRLETAALAVGEPRRAALEAALTAAGVRRFCRVGRAQEPDMRAPHDGRPRLGVLVETEPGARSHLARR